MKKCCTCKRYKQLTSYCKDRNRHDGLYPQCRSCQKIVGQKYYIKHRTERIAAVQRYAGTIRGKQLIHERSKRHYAEHREEELAAAKQWRRSNRERRRAYIRKWNKENRAKVRGYQKAYKIRRYGTRPELTDAGWKIILAIFRNRCVYCGKKTLKLEQDHVIALSQHGKHTCGNVVPACRSCNAIKAQYKAPPFWWNK